MHIRFFISIVCISGNARTCTVGEKIVWVIKQPRLRVSRISLTYRLFCTLSSRLFCAILSHRLQKGLSFAQPHAGIIAMSMCFRFSCIWHPPREHYWRHFHRPFVFSSSLRSCSCVDGVTTDERAASKSRRKWQMQRYNT